MEQRIYHGRLTPKDIAQALMGEFNRGNFRAQSFGNDKKLTVQITTSERLQSGGQTALSVFLNQVEDGVAVQIGKQAWLGVAASLGQTLLSAWHHPWNVISRLDDLAQDIQSIQLTEDVTKLIEETAQHARATFELSERLRRTVCEYCFSANLVGSSHCLACGAPMGANQPQTCANCGYVIKPEESKCPNCGQVLK